MSLKYYIFFISIVLHAQRTIIIHPHASNRVIHHTYEWDLTHQAALELQEIGERIFPEYISIVTPLSYAKLPSFDTISFINTHNSSYCIILSFYEYTQGIATVRLYYPYYENEEHSTLSFSSLSFIPYQYGYRKNSTLSHKFVLSLQEELLSSEAMFKTLPYKRAPLKIGIGVQSPTILIEIGINSLTTLTSVLTILAHALHTIIREDF